MSKPKIFYLCPDNIRPSWGLGIIYHHVKALCAAGYEAYVIHEKAYFKVDWLSLDVPILYLNQLPIINVEDILFVPEVMVNIAGLKSLDCRKILFVQASSFLFEKLPDNETHKSLGFESALVTMPHMIPIIEQFTELRVNLVPPFVADYFYKEKSKLNEREKIILIFPKFHQQDYGIIRRLINDKLQQNASLSSLAKQGWKLIEMKDKTHKQVAELMKKATFFIATNTFESFNASVVEAMAAGCINVCYEGFGPRDYLVNNKNAFVFKNNEAFELCRHLFLLIDEEQEIVLKQMRQNAFETALHYSYENTRQQLIQYFETILFKQQVA